MRGKGKNLARALGDAGITPAHAGKSDSGRHPAGAQRDHPRACGEKMRSYSSCVISWGSPPRMRGKEVHGQLDPQDAGITPAHAGKRRRSRRITGSTWDHPRACGEKVEKRTKMLRFPGSPPRMRGKDHRRDQPHQQGGITPAHAGKSWYWRLISSAEGDHPRACGEKLKHDLVDSGKMGSPPRMRGKEIHATKALVIVGITPAHAGKRRLRLHLRRAERDHPRACGEKTKGSLKKQGFSSAQLPDFIQFHIDLLKHPAISQRAVRGQNRNVQRLGQRRELQI